MSMSAYSVRKATGPDLPTFEISLFHSGYHKSGNHSPSISSSVLHTEFPSEECTDTVRVLNSRQEYNVVFPICHSIASPIASHGTDQFEAYLQAMKTAEEMVRRGTNLQFRYFGGAGHKNKRSTTTGS